MPDLVSDGTCFSCPCCSSKLKIFVPASPAEANSKKLANTSNFNFPPPGGQCSITSSPCMPTVSNIDPGQKVVQIGGEVALGVDCKFQCAMGGLITVDSPGQTTAKHDEATIGEILSVIPDLAMVILSRGRKKPSVTTFKTGTKLLRAIKAYLSNMKSVKKGKLVKDLESMGLKLKGESPDGKFKTFVDKKGRVRAQIHPPDKKVTPNSTKYDHVHIYDSKGRPLDKSLKTGKENSPDVHIEYGGE